MGTYSPGVATPKQFQDMFQIVGTGTVAGTVTGTFTANTVQTQVVTVPGAALGDIVDVSVSVDAVSKQISAYVNAAGSVTVLYSPEASTTAVGAHNIIYCVRRLNPSYT